MYERAQSRRVRVEGQWSTPPYLVARIAKLHGTADHVSASNDGPHGPRYCAQAKMGTAVPIVDRRDL